MGWKCVSWDMQRTSMLSELSTLSLLWTSNKATRLAMFPQAVLPFGVFLRASLPRQCARCELLWRFQYEASSVSLIICSELDYCSPAGSSNLRCDEGSRLQLRFKLRCVRDRSNNPALVSHCQSVGRPYRRYQTLPIGTAIRCKMSAAVGKGTNCFSSDLGGLSSTERGKPVPPLLSTDRNQQSCERYRTILTAVA